MDINWHSETLLHGIHAFKVGKGTPVILLPGWPQTAEAYAEVASTLMENYEVWAVDPPGLGDSAASAAGYDTKSISRTLEEAIRTALPNKKYHLVGHDVGAWIAYPWAAQFAESILSLTVLDSAIPGKAPPLSFPLPDEANMKLWQFSFNRLPDLPEILTKGRERELLDWLFATKARYPERISKQKRDRYVQCYSKPGAMSQGFAYYRAVTASAKQNAAFGEKKLGMPVLAMGAQSGVANALKVAMEGLAGDVNGGIIEDCGHYVMEEQPEAVSSRLIRFFEEVEK